MDHRLDQQLSFISEANKLRKTVRDNFLLLDNQQDNIAEYTWQSILLAQLLHEYANSIAKVDLLYVIRMLTVHDLVCGFAKHSMNPKGQTECNAQFNQENQAARKLFAMLPYNQGKQYYELWLEYENEKTVNARFAKIIHLMTPILTNQNMSVTKAVPEEIFKTLLVGKKETQKIEERLRELLPDIS